MKIYIRSFIILLVLICFYSCRNDVTGPYNNPGLSSDSAITIMDSLGRFISGDTLDWCYKCPANVVVDTGVPPVYSGSCTKIYPPYPNPVTDTFHIRFDLESSENAQIYYMEGHTQMYLINGHYMAGSYKIDLTANALGLHHQIRKFYFNTPQGLCSGDVQFR